MLPVIHTVNFLDKRKHQREYQPFDRRNVYSELKPGAEFK